MLDFRTFSSNRRQLSDMYDVLVYCKRMSEWQADSDAQRIQVDGSQEDAYNYGTEASLGFLLGELSRSMGCDRSCLVFRSKANNSSSFPASA